MRHLFASASMVVLLAAPGLAVAQTEPPARPYTIPGPSSMPNPDMMNGPSGIMPGPGMMPPNAGGSQGGMRGPHMMAGPNGMPGPGGNMMGPRGPNGPGRANMRPPINDQDRQFVERATSAGLAEVEAGNLALHRAASTAVREFGRWMVTDHTEMGDMLAHRAQHAGLNAPNQINEKDRAALNALQQFHDADFDVHYLADQLDAHKQAMELFKQEAQSGEDPWLRSFAQHMQKMLEQHLAQVEELKSTPESSTARSAEVTVPPAAPMPDAKTPSPNLHEGTTPEVRHSLNEEGARRTETEGK